jgi:hypothetical protein
MDSINNQRLIDVFIAIAKDARNSGDQVLSEWHTLKPTYLHKGEPLIAQSLYALDDVEYERMLSLIKYAERTSAYYFLKRLEEGEAGYEFTLTMRDTNTGESVTLSAPETPDLNLRAKMLD